MTSSKLSLKSRSRTVEPDKNVPESDLIPKPSFDVAGMITNVSVAASVLKSPSAQGVVKSIGNKFLKEALVIREKNGTSVATTLASAGGVIGWISQSSVASKLIGSLDAIIDSQVVTPAMVAQLIDEPKLLAELVKSFEP